VAARRDHGAYCVFSFAWSSDQLTGSAIPSSAGHLAVFVGFDASGNPIVNDPAAASDGTVYLIYPQGL
jgi:hypothetical protein